MTEVSDWLVKTNFWRHCETASDRGFWLFSKKTIWIHSECTSERGFWTLLKNTEDILRLQLSEVFDWLVKKKLKTFWVYIWARFLKKYWKDWRHSEATTVRGLSLVSKKNMWRHSEATNKQTICLKSKIKVCDDILRLHLSEVFE